MISFLLQVFWDSQKPVRGCSEENLNREAYYHKSLVEFQTAIEIQIVAEPGWNRHSFSELPDIWLTFFRTSNKRAKLEPTELENFQVVFERKLSRRSSSFVTWSCSFLYHRLYTSYFGRSIAAIRFVMHGRFQYFKGVQPCCL